LAAQDFYLVDRLSTFANDICDMFADGDDASVTKQYKLVPADGR